MPGIGEVVGGVTNVVEGVDVAEELGPGKATKTARIGGPRGGRDLAEREADVDAGGGAAGRGPFLTIGPAGGLER